MRYHVKALSHRAWLVVDACGHPLYDDGRYGDDKPVVFMDPDDAEACAERLNSAEDEVQDYE